jgi:hypothetical protein
MWGCFEDIKYIKHRESGIQWNRAFDIKLSHASSLGSSSATLDCLSESDKVTEQKAHGPLHQLLDFLFNLFWKNQKIGNSKYGIFMSKWGKNLQIVVAQ